MDLKLKDKVIIVGGGEGGIGTVVCDFLREEGARVISLDKKKGDDLSNPEMVKRVFSEIRKHNRELYGYCSLTYGGGGESGILEATPWDVEGELRGTLLSAVYPIQEAIRWMKETGGGHIVIVSSINSVLGLNEFAYDLAKGALNRIAPDIAIGCGKYGIYAVTLCPGNVIDTPAWKDKQADIERIAKVIPDGKPEKSIDVARTVAFLVSPFGEMFNGCTLIADRGWHLKPLFKDKKD